MWFFRNKDKDEKEPSDIFSELKDFTSEGKSPPESVWHRIVFKLYDIQKETKESLKEHERECILRGNVMIIILIVIAVIVILAMGPEARQTVMGMFIR